MTVNGAMELLAGERLSVYLYSSSDSSYTVTNASSFSLRFIGLKESAPGFQADLTYNTLYRSTGWRELKNYRIYSSNTGMFTEGDSFSTSTGRFTAPCSGAYFASANVRLDAASGAFFRLMVAVNGDTSLKNGLTAIRGNPPSSYYTMNVAGVVNLTRGDYLSVWVYSYQDTRWYLNGESGFSVVFLNDLSQLSSGVHADLKSDVSITSTGYSRVTGWLTSGTAGLFTTGAFNGNSGKFTVPVDGAYFISSQLRLDSASGMSKAFIAIDGKEEHVGLQHEWENPPSTFYTLTACGIVWLKTGQVVSPQIYSKRDNNLAVQDESGFSVHYLQSRASWSGFHSHLLNKVSGTSKTWKELKGWTSMGNKKGLFVVGSSFDAASGKYTLAMAGIYFVSANVQISNDGGSITRLSVAIDGVVSSAGGLTAVRENPSSQTYTLSVGGFLQLNNGQNITLQLLSASVSQWTVEPTSDFTVSFICGSLSVPAFSVHVAADTSVSSSGWQEVTGYSLTGAKGLFQSGGSNLNFQTGRFTAPVSGIYIIAANAEIFFGSGDFYRCRILLNANTSATKTGLESTVGGPGGKRFTCTVAGTITLSVGDQVSLWIYSDSDADWKVSNGTAFSAVYTGRVGSTRSSVLAALKADTAFTASGWKELSRYEVTGDLQFVAGRAFTSTSGRYKSAKQGLYFVSTQVNIITANNSVFSVRICVNGDPASDGPYSVRSSLASKYLSLTALGMIKLEAKSNVSVCVNSKKADSWTIAGNSGFSVNALLPVPETPGAVVFVSPSKAYRQSSWVEITTYKLAGKTGLYLSGINASLTTNGRFYAPTDGIYFVSANIRLDYSSGTYFRGVIAINGKTDASNGLHSRRGYPPYYYYTISVSGSVLLSANDYVSVFVESATDTSWTLNTESSFSVRFLSYKLPAIGFLSDVVVDKSYISKTGWTEIGNWRTNNSAGLFSSGKGFDPTTGRYTIQQSGIYIVAANIELSGAGVGTFQVQAVVDRNVKSNNGMVSVRQSTPNNYYTFSLSGAMYLTKGQTLSIFVHSQSDTNWKLSHESGFSATYHSPYQYVPGFHVVLGSTKTVTTAYWKEISGWATPTTGAGLFQSSNDFDWFTGRFTAPYSGEYFVSANVRLDYASHPYYRYYRLIIIVNGVLSSTTNIVQCITSSNPNSYTLAASGIVRLKKWDYISVWIYNYYDTYWRIGADSGFSVIFMGGDDQPERCINNGPKFIIHPLAVSKKVGGSTTLSCRAVGSPAPTYQWTFAGNVISGATEANYTLINVTKSNTGDYRCVATVGSAISKTSNPARLTVYDPQPRFDASQYTYSLSENGLPNRYIGFVRARADTASGTSQSLTYTLIAGNPRNNFTLRSYSTIAYLYVRGTLDREVLDSIKLTVKATNNAQTSLSATVNVTVQILDLNDNTPVFSQPYYTTNVTENSPVGTTVTHITATDADATSNGKLTFSILSGNDNGAFAIDSSTGYIVTANPIDRERQIDYLLFVEVSDNPNNSLPRTNRTSVRIAVLDANDNSPSFDSPAYSQTVSEGAIVGTNVLQLAARDDDVGTNADITYNITAGNTDEAFNINSVDGILFVSKSLDREAVAVYSLTVTATDSGTPRQTGTTLVTVTISDVNDHSPTFSLSSYTTSLSENLPSGTPVLRVLATEKDTSSISVITYSLDKSVSSTFSIDSKTGNVTTVHSFDREVKSQYVFTVYAADSAASPRTGSATVTVDIQDENDNSPSFSKSSYQATIQETVGIGTTVLQLSASDKDFRKNGTVTYSFSSRESHFVLDQITGIIRTDSNLNYVSQSSYILTVVATDGGIPPRSDTAIVLVNLTDANDNAPVFRQYDYNATVPETAGIGTRLLTVSASDGDAGTNAKITYFISGGNVGSKFYIDPQKGEIQIAASLDYETINSYSIIVTASDGGRPQQTAATLVRITVSDVNDNSPLFTQASYVSKVTDDVPNGTVIATVRANDADSGAYGKVNYGIQGGSSYFGISGKTGDVYTTNSLRTPSQRLVSLQITASDGGHPAKLGYSVLIITIVSNQVSALIFPVTNYTVFVPENATKGSTILTVQATSQNSTVASSVSYKMSNPASAPFQIDSKTGTITVKSTLDRESTPNGYRFVVEAQAGQQVAHADVRIILVDVNDNSPVFRPVYYSVSIPDTTSVGTTILQVNAQDQDTGSNKKVTYTLIQGDQGRFTIDSVSGIIRTASIFNSSTGSSSILTVVAVDGGVPALSASAQVTVQIKATVNRPPQFSSSTYTFVRAEDISVGSVIGIVQAYDHDAAPFNKLAYSIRSNSSTPFQIETNTGGIKTIAQLDYESRSSFTMTVIATDSGKPVMTAQALVSVIVTDVNDNSPVFTQPSYKQTVSDQLSLGSTILQVAATDKDSGTNGQLLFSLGNHHNIFHIDATSGLLSLSAKLDHSVKDSYSLTVTAKDGGMPSRSTNAIVIISVVPVDKFKPVFTLNTYASQIREDSAIGTVVVSVTANEGTPSGQPTISYSISGVGANQFAIDPAGGTITVASSLNREDIPAYNLIVTAKDSRIPLQSATASVAVTIIDVNDNGPVFTQTNYQASVYESTSTGVSLVVVQATDSDIGKNGLVLYSITNGNGNSVFKINPNTGVISTQASLDRETTSKYILRVTASDQGTPRRTAVVTVVITVTDVNDNSPTFDPPVYTASVTENAKYGSSVLTVSATDLDTGNNAKLTYSIESQPETSLPFTIGSSSGLVVTNDKLHLQTYRFVVKASDNGSPPLSGSCEVSVTVNDINDHKPEFPTSGNVSYSAIISSSTEVPAEVLTITAKDVDEGPNGEITYSIESGNPELPFKIAKKTGIISLTRKVSTGQTFSFTVVATDGANISLSSSVEVHITVSDHVAAPSAGKDSDNTVIYVGAPVGALAAILLIFVVILVVLKKKNSFQWSRHDNCTVDLSVAFSSESPDNLAFSNPIYADTESAAKENKLYQLPAAIKTNPLYSSANELDRIRDGFEDI
jgi:hypothetical protein